MPYRTKWEDRGIVWEFHGDVSARDIERANEEFYADPRSDRTRYQIIDATETASVEWAQRDITHVAAHDAGAAHGNAKLRVAYVASDATIVSLLEKYVELARRMNSTWEFRGFADVAAAREWIAT